MFASDLDSRDQHYIPVVHQSENSHSRNLREVQQVHRMICFCIPLFLRSFQGKSSLPSHHIHRLGLDLLKRNIQVQNLYTPLAKIVLLF